MTGSKPTHEDRVSSSPSLLRNIILNVGGRGSLTLLSLVTTPLLIHRLGIDIYGIFILASSLGGILGLLDLGLTPAFVALLSHALHNRDRAQIQQIIGTAFTLYLGIGIVGCIILALLVPWMTIALLHVPSELATIARFALYISTVSFAINMWFAVFNVIPTALERYDIVAVRIVGLTLISNIIMIIYLWRGGNLYGVLVLNLIMGICGTLLFWAVSRSLLPTISFRPGFDAAIFRELSRFSAYKFAGTLGGILSFRFDQFVIGTVLGLGGVALYAVPSNAAQRISSILGELTAPLYPRVSRLRGNNAQIQQLFLRANRLIAFAAAVALLPLFTLADKILTYWIAGEQGRQIAVESTTVMRWLILAFFIQALASVPVTFCEALGKPEINNSFSIASAIIHIPLVLILVPRFGIIGAAIALFLNSITQTLAFVLFATYRLIGLTPWQLLRNALGRPLALACCLILTGYAARPLVHNIPTLIGAMFILGIASLPLAMLTRTIQTEDYLSIGRIIDQLPTRFPGQAIMSRWCHMRGA